MLKSISSYSTTLNCTKSTGFSQSRSISTKKITIQKQSRIPFKRYQSTQPSDSQPDLNPNEPEKRYNKDGERELTTEEAEELLEGLKKIWESPDFPRSPLALDPPEIQERYRVLFEKYEIGGLASPSCAKMLNTILNDPTDSKAGSKIIHVQFFHKALMDYHLKKQMDGTEAPNAQNSIFNIFGGVKPSEGESGNKENSKDGGNTPIPPSLKFDTMLLWLSSMALTYFIFTVENNEREITWQDFVTTLYEKHYVDRLIVYNNDTVRVTLNDLGKNQPTHDSKVDYYFTIGSVQNFEEKLKALQDEKKVPEELRIPVMYLQTTSIFKSLYNIMPTLVLFGFIFWSTKKMLTSGGGIGGGLFGSQAKTFKKFNAEKQVNINFEDVAGCDEAKEEIMEFVKFLKNPKKYEKLGAKIPRGAILSGPPGTGKTMLAKATAGEAGVPFYSVSGSEFVEMFVGVGASRVRELFKTARENAPAIIFVDEIDAIGKSRSKGGKGPGGANDERENTLNQLLVEMDGFSTSDYVVVLAGTNRADVLDSALMRPGRFDRKVYLDNPELEGRKAIFAVHLKKITLSEDCDIEDLKGRLATLTPGFSGADIANCCNEAALIAARHNENSVRLHDFEQAIERVIAGLEKKSKLLSPQEKRIVAYHEAGHAICGWFLEYADPLLKVSIVPRGQGALGYAQYLPPDIYLYSTQKLLDRMTMTLGGRVSEELHFASVTSGGSDDFEKVTNLAQRMVLECGMSPKVGLINYNLDRGNDMTKPFSDKTSSLIDSEIHRLVEESYERCKNLLIEKKEEVKLVAEELLTKEVITREDMIRLLGKRPFTNRNDAFDKYLADKDERDHSKAKKEDDQKEK
ncbi:hypothetical protein CANARDRAFT_29088 [[Candida] arabinofermentans NRRL YB-2248]|uniref:AAA+ ATPase domain-containing protein n=1 Tax=[Candida] arabinofermentans NRRL YB-2248 TaxID=983967 RepID=A0A1E4SYL6_9ASCO|nr:hypothetical protein CANARDRAFT_29088 [[Candida] arabinofermentans NRRL YB-2248]